MEALMQWGILAILSMQSVPGLTGVMQFFSFLGREEFFLFFIPAIYWCVDAKLGARLAVVLIASNALNILLKAAFHLPRPYWIDLRVKALGAELSYGLPSGHAMNATAVWGLLASQVRKGWVWAALAALVLMISLSRLYLGVHFPTDVLAGWIFGALLLALFPAIEQPVVARLRRLSMGRQIGLTLAVSLLYFTLFSGILTAIAPTPDPDAWERNAAVSISAKTGRPATDPRNPKDGSAAAGLILGLGLAFALSSRSAARFETGGPLARKGLRFAVGMAGVLFFWLGLKAAAPAEPAAMAVAFRYLRYALAIFWALHLAPRVFIRLKL